jgi:hypothetical protein
MEESKVVRRRSNSAHHADVVSAIRTTTRLERVNSDRQPFYYRWILYLLWLLYKMCLMSGKRDFVCRSGVNAARGWITLPSTAYVIRKAGCVEGKGERVQDMIPPNYCHGAEWHGEALRLISQFMGRLARVSRIFKSTDIRKRRQRDSETDRQTDTGVIVFIFNSILFQTFIQRNCLISAHSGPRCLLLSPCWVLYGQR